MIYEFISAGAEKGNEGIKILVVMGSKRLSWISLVLSIIALVVGVIALVNRCPTQDLYLHFDYMGVIVGILALLVTALIGAQVGQYVFVDRKIEKIAGRGD